MKDLPLLLGLMPSFTMDDLHNHIALPFCSVSVLTGMSIDLVAR